MALPGGDTSGRKWPATYLLDERQSRHLLTSAVLGGAVIVCLFGAPVALVLFNGSLSDDDLARMSNVSQAYGGLLSGLAMTGIAAALIVQVRQVRISQAQGVRLMQIELMKLLLDDPDLRPLSPSVGKASQEQRRRDIYSNLIIRYLEMGYEIGYFPADSLRVELRGQFSIPDIVQFWERARPFHASGIQNSAQRRFMELVDEAHREAVGRRDASPPPLTGREEARRAGMSVAAGRRPPAFWLVVASLVGIAIGVSRCRCVSRAVRPSHRR